MTNSIEKTTQLSQGYNADPLDKALDVAAGFLPDAMMTLVTELVPDPELSKAINPIDFFSGTALNNVLNGVQLLSSLSLHMWAIHREDRNDPIDRKTIAVSHFLNILAPTLALRAVSNTEQLIRAFENNDLLSGVIPAVELGVLVAAGVFNGIAIRDHIRHKSLPVKPSPTNDSDHLSPLRVPDINYSKPPRMAHRQWSNNKGQLVNNVSPGDERELAPRYLPTLGRYETYGEVSKRIMKLLNLNSKEEVNEWLQSVYKDLRESGYYDGEGGVQSSDHQAWLDFFHHKKKHLQAVAGKPRYDRKPWEPPSKLESFRERIATEPTGPDYYIGTQHYIDDLGTPRKQRHEISSESLSNMGYRRADKLAHFKSAWEILKSLFAKTQTETFSDPVMAKTVRELYEEISAVAPTEPTLLDIINQDYVDKREKRKGR